MTTTTGGGTQAGAEEALLGRDKVGEERSGGETRGEIQKGRTRGGSVSQFMQGGMKSGTRGEGGGECRADGAYREVDRDI